MPKVTWLGEGKDGPQQMEWKGQIFKVGEAVDTEDDYIIQKAKNNKFFKVEGVPLAAVPPVAVPPVTVPPLTPKK